MGHHQAVGRASCLQCRRGGFCEGDKHEPEPRHIHDQVTGSGTFEVPEKDEEGDDVTGGGTWDITTGAVSSHGTYKVTGVVLWFEAPGTFPGAFTDNIGNPADARAGFAVLRIKYSDGERGILVVSCSFVGTPNTVFEGITASKGFTDFWKAQPPTGTPTTPNANRTLFHVVRDDDDN